MTSASDRLRNSITRGVPQHTSTIRKLWIESMIEEQDYRLLPGIPVGERQHWVFPEYPPTSNASTVWVSFSSFTGFDRPMTNLNTLICPCTKITDEQLNIIKTLRNLDISRCPNITRVDGLTRLEHLNAIDTNLHLSYPLPSTLTWFHYSGINEIPPLELLLSGTKMVDVALAGPYGQHETVNISSMQSLRSISLNILTPTGTNTTLIIPETVEQMTVYIAHTLAIETISGNPVKLSKLAIGNATIIDLNVDWYNLSEFELFNCNLEQYIGSLEVVYRTLSSLRNMISHDYIYYSRLRRLSVRNINWETVNSIIWAVKTLKHLECDNINGDALCSAPSTIQLETVMVRNNYSSHLEHWLLRLNKVSTLSVENSVVIWNQNVFESLRELTLVQVAIHGNFMAPPMLKTLNLNQVNGRSINLSIPSSLINLRVECVMESGEYIKVVMNSELHSLTVVRNPVSINPAKVSELIELTLLCQRYQPSIPWHKLVHLNKLTIDNTIQLLDDDIEHLWNLSELRMHRHAINPRDIYIKLPKLRVLNSWQASTISDSQLRMM